MQGNQVIRYHLNDDYIFIEHADSKKIKGIQIADLISWSVYQYIENNDDEYFNLIKNKVIKRVFED